MPLITTPDAISRPLRQMIHFVVPNGMTHCVMVKPEAEARIGQCFLNVVRKVAQDGGRMLCGWQFWEWPHVMMEAEFHAIWLSQEGSMVDVTPKSQGEKTVLFLPDPRRTYNGVVIDNVRRAIRNDLLVHDLIKVSEAITQATNRGERAGSYGVINVPIQEIEPLLAAKKFLGMAIASGRRDHSPCLCGSGKKYKRCHGPRMELMLR